LEGLVEYNSNFDLISNSELMELRNKILNQKCD
jgi:hypothetical protein